MNPKQLCSIIGSTCEELAQLKLLSFHNLPCQTWEKNILKVSSPFYHNSAHLFPFGSLEQFYFWIKNGHFTCLLFDYSLIRATYHYLDGDVLVGHNLLYWPCPIEFIEPIETLSDLCDGLEMCLESPSSAAGICKLNLRSPMRFDHDPTSVKDDHPEIHLHTEFEDVRIYVHHPICFNKFIKIIFKTFYNSKWEFHRSIHELHEQPINKHYPDLHPSPYLMQVTWE